MNVDAAIGAALLVGLCLGVLVQDGYDVLSILERWLRKWLA